MTDIEKVKKLGDEIGYGHLMHLASALWRNVLRDAKTPLDGAFVPTILPFIKKQYRKMANKSIDKYDNFVNRPPLRDTNTYLETY